MLDGYELASLLSYGAAGEPPDAELRELAGSTGRRGILHHASFLTSASWSDIPSYAHRGGAVASTTRAAK